MNSSPAPTSAGASYLSPGDRHHENTDVNVNWVLLFAMGMLIGAVLTHLVLWVFLHGLALTEPRKERRPPPPADARPQAPPEPRLQTDFFSDLKQTRLDEDARLTQYEWRDKSASIVRIPIDRAMELVAQRGLPEWKPKDPSELTPDVFGNVRIGGKPPDRKESNEQ